MAFKEWLFGRKKTDEGGTGTATAPHETPTEEKPSEAQTSETFFSKLKNAVANTGRTLFGGLEDQFDGQDRPLDEDALDTIEETLLRADVGVKTTMAILDEVRTKRQQITTHSKLMNFLKGQFTGILCPTGDESANRLAFQPGRMNVYLVVGVNGSGKTTFIGKLAHRFAKAGHSVVIGAGDTFRAAADEQLAVWAERAGATMIRKPPGTDPAAVLFETMEAAKEANAEIVILDTAGRLQNKFNLMEELKKIRRVVDKALPEGGVVEPLLVIDATTGQNALQQAQVFKEAVQLSGVVLTKLDGSAKGGVILAIAKEYGLPVKMVGVGEGIEDLQDFSPSQFLDALFAGR